MEIRFRKMGALHIAITDKYIFMCYASGTTSPKIGVNEDPEIVEEIISNYEIITEKDFESVVLNVIPNPNDSIFWKTYEKSKTLIELSH